MDPQVPNPRSGWFISRDGPVLVFLLLLSIVEIAFSFLIEGQMMDLIDHQLTSSISPEIFSTPWEISPDQFPSKPSEWGRKR